MSEPDVEMLSLTEAAERMGVGPQGVRALIKDGECGGSEIGLIFFEETEAC